MSDGTKLMISPVVKQRPHCVRLSYLDELYSIIKTQDYREYDKVQTNQEVQVVSIEGVEDKIEKY